MWLYKVCKQHKKSKTYTLIGRYTDKRNAEHAAELAAFFDHYEHKFTVKRFSGEPGDIF